MDCKGALLRLYSIFIITVKKRGEESMIKHSVYGETFPIRPLNQYDIVRFIDRAHVLNQGYVIGQGYIYNVRCMTIKDLMRVCKDVGITLKVLSKDGWQLFNNRKVCNLCPVITDIYYKNRTLQITTKLTS